MRRVTYRLISWSRLVDLLLRLLEIHDDLEVTGSSSKFIHNGGDTVATSSTIIG